uniref:Uncharacterized protein n=1 Tax=Parascaris equorum TaxID=6256 RepID=A0A914SBS8_PAREQ
MYVRHLHTYPCVRLRCICLADASAYTVYRNGTVGGDARMTSEVERGREGTNWTHTAHC